MAQLRKDGWYSTPDGHWEHEDEFKGCWIPCLFLIIGVIVCFIVGIAVPLYILIFGG